MKKIKEKCSICDKEVEIPASYYDILEKMFIVCDECGENEPDLDDQDE